VDFKVYKPGEAISDERRHEIADFLLQHLEQYGDPKEDILRCLDYALSESEDKGGFVLTGSEDGEIVGVVVINRTGMRGYIPENILVYIATHNQYRGRGFGKQIIKEAIKQTEGDVALHVEADNPAKFLYEKVGFTNPYLEMRLKKSNFNG
jgi:GNAT superfamily N-acetyltransferase